MNSYICSPEYNLLRDAYLGPKPVMQSKLLYLDKMAQDEKWDYHGNNEKRILYNYLCYTYDRIKQENKIEISDDNKYMCFNTGLLTKNGADIYAYFIENINNKAKQNQKWFLYGFKQRTDKEMRVFKKYPEIADYFTKPEDFIYDRSKELNVDYDHIVDDNYDRFVEIGLTDKYMIQGLLTNAVKRIIEKVKRNYKLAIPQFYTDKNTGESKIQLLLPLFMQSKDIADLALVVDKGDYSYTGKTILAIEWAYVNSRRIVKPDVDWLRI
ncbi:MAG: DUF3825 domain-containing protein [Clostridia bacterium]|jgi:hypothetical protein|nr:DUF3825 domain-containing protein [Clostridia bacterium]